MLVKVGEEDEIRREVTPLVLDKEPGLKYEVTPELLKIAYLPIANACKSESLLPGASATKKSVFFAGDLIGAACNGSNGGPFRNFEDSGGVPSWPGMADFRTCDFHSFDQEFD